MPRYSSFNQPRQHALGYGLQLTWKCCLSAFRHCLCLSLRRESRLQDRHGLQNQHPSSWSPPVLQDDARGRGLQRAHFQRFRYRRHADCFSVTSIRTRTAKRLNKINPTRITTEKPALTHAECVFLKNCNITFNDTLRRIGHEIESLCVSCELHSRLICEYVK